MKKETEFKTVSELYEEYNKKVSEQKENADKIKRDIADCASMIERLEGEIDKNINSLTPELYAQKMSEIEKIRSAKELHTKKLSVMEGSTLKGFDSEEDKRQFAIRLKVLYKAGEEEFVRECDKHLKALEELLNDRNTEATKGMTLAQKIGDVSLLYSSAVRKIVSQAVSARNLIKE